MSYQNILITLDGSALAETALAHVPHLADPATIIHLLSVVDNAELARRIALSETMAVPTSLSMEPEVTVNLTEELDVRTKYVQTIIDKLAKEGFQASAEISHGNVIDAIVERASQGIDLLLMASHGRTGFNKLIFGSVAEQVLHKMPCPILIVGPQHPHKHSAGPGGHAATVGHSSH